MAFGYYTPLTVQSGQVPSTQTNFPMLVSDTDAHLKVVGSGGHVQHSSGYDIYFYKSDGTTRLPAEREAYNSATGAIVAWVNVDSIADSTVIRRYYGDAGISTDPNSDGTYGKTSTWDSNYKGVYHFGDGTTFSVADSTSNGNDLTNHGITAVAGKVGGAGRSDGSTTYATGPSLDLGTANTIQAWAKSSDLSGSYRNIIHSGGNNYYNLFTYNDGASHPARYLNGFTIGGSSLSTGTWYALASTYDIAGSGPVVVYKNGASDGTTNAGSSTSGATTFTLFTHPDLHDYWKDDIDEVRLSAVARSANWLATDYNTQSAPASFYSVGSETSIGGNSYTLTATSGSFTQTGTAANLLQGRKVSAAAGSYAWSGVATALSRIRLLTCTPGAYTLTGINTRLLADRYLQCEVGSFVETGIAVAFRVGYRVPASVGSYALTGIDAAFRRTLLLPASAGSYSWSGAAVTLLKGRTVAASPGSFAWAGTDAALKYARIFGVANGSYAWTGASAPLLYGRRLIAGIGSYAWTGITANFLRGLRFVVDPGSFVLTGTGAALSTGSHIVLSADPGSFALTGIAAGLRTTRLLVMGTGSWQLTGTAASLLAARKVVPAAGSYAWSGIATGLTTQRRVSAAAGSYVWMGTAVAFQAQRKLTVAAGSHAWTGVSAVLTAQRRLTASGGSFVQTGQTAALLAQRRLQCGVGALVWSGVDASFLSPFSLDRLDFTSESLLPWAAFTNELVEPDDTVTDEQFG